MGTYITISIDVICRAYDGLFMENEIQMVVRYDIKQ